MARWQPSRSDVIREYAEEVLGVFPQGRVVVGLDGIETPWSAERLSGREAFARDLAGAVVDAGTPAAAVRLGDFLRGDDASGAPDDLYDVAAFRERVLAPYRRGDDLELPSGDAESETTFSPGDRAVLVVSGPFAHLGELAGVWHRSAWLQIPRAEAFHREAERLRVPEDGPRMTAWQRSVAAAFRIRDARKSAAASFDLTDPEHPRRRFEDAC